MERSVANDPLRTFSEVTSCMRRRYNPRRSPCCSGYSISSSACAAWRPIHVVLQRPDVELSDDLLSSRTRAAVAARRVLGRTDAEPTARLATRHELAHSWKVGECFPAHRAGYDESANLPRFDVLKRSRQRIEQRFAPACREDQPVLGHFRCMAHAPCRGILTYLSETDSFVI